MHSDGATIFQPGVVLIKSQTRERQNSDKVQEIKTAWMEAKKKNPRHM